MTSTIVTHWLRDLAERLRLVIQGDGLVDEHDISQLIDLAAMLDEERDRK
jgi:alpha-L-fucosidase